MIIVIIGAGPAGMMAASAAAKNGADVVLLEKNRRQGRKLMITGKGRCNITNNCAVEKLIENTATNPRFLYSAFSQFSSRNTMEYFEKLGVPLKTERGDRVFPQSDKASDINDAMVGDCRKNRVRFVPDAAVDGIIVDNGRVIAVTAGERRYECDSLIIATGGCSYPATGSTGDGYKLARAAGHTIIKPEPSLVPLETEGNECKAMQGLSLRNVAVRVRDSKNVIYTDFGELLFTHFGLSGPVVLSASSHMKKAAGCVFSIDLKPALTLEQLDDRLRRDFEKNINRDFQNSLGGLLPSGMIPVIVERSGIPPELKCNSIKKEQRAALAQLLKGFELKITGFRPVEEAIVTSGGVKTSEIDPKTMRSKLVENLYFAGEIIDVDAHTGGFNLQIALSTGFCAGRSASERRCGAE